MKVDIGSALLAHYQLRGTTIAYALKITRKDGQTFGESSNGATVTLAGFSYSASNLLTISSLDQTVGFAVDTMMLEVRPSATAMTGADIYAGRWNRARYELRKFNTKVPTDGGEIVRTGTLGEFTLKDSKFSVELRSLKQELAQPIGLLTQKTCRYRFGDSGCGVDTGPLTVTGTFTAVAGRITLTDSARTEVDDYFGEGLLTVTTGEAAGLSQKIRTFAAGVFGLYIPLQLAVAVDDEYEATPGCRLRFEEDCGTKWDNRIRFGGQPFVPGSNLITAPPSNDSAP